MLQAYIIPGMEERPRIVGYRMTPDYIISVVSDVTQIPVKVLKGLRGNRRISDARQITMSLIRQNTPLSLKEIGLIFGGRDHSTVIHALQCVQDHLKIEEKYRELMNDINNLL